MEPIVGIDLGTTNSEVAIVRDGQPVVFEEDGDPILPSFVGLSEDGRLLVGKAARNQWVLAPERTVKSIKRKMGQDVKATPGDTQLGGDDFDDQLLNLLCDRFQQEHGVNLRATPATRARVLRAAENAKKQLSSHPFARIQEEFIAEKAGQPLHLDVEISREEYE